MYQYLFCFLIGVVAVSIASFTIADLLNSRLQDQLSQLKADLHNKDWAFNRANKELESAKNDLEVMAKSKMTLLSLNKIYKARWEQTSEHWREVIDAKVARESEEQPDGRFFSVIDK